jgi:hypothetical protein
MTKHNTEKERERDFGVSQDSSPYLKYSHHFINSPVTNLLHRGLRESSRLFNCYAERVTRGQRVEFLKTEPAPGSLSEKHAAYAHVLLKTMAAIGYFYWVTCPVMLPNTMAPMYVFLMFLVLN